VTLPDILLEDDFLVAFDKPGGLAVASDRRGGSTATLMGMVRERFGRLAANVHRLDAQASGVVLCAKTKAALDSLSGQFQSKSVRATYGALVALPEADWLANAASPARDAGGALPPEFSVDLPLGEDAGEPGRMRVVKGRGGRPSATLFRVVEPFGRFAWLECLPQTARRHQVRVHLAAAGAPVLNDALYGDPASVLLLSGLKRGYKGSGIERPLISRLALHAVSLEFLHPVRREPVRVAAPLPRDFEVALKYLRRFAAPAGGPFRARGARGAGSGPSRP
jgi:23S rRNA pseudouridine1911/1915/1917 synthase